MAIIRRNIGQLDHLRHCPAAGHVATALKIILNNTRGVPLGVSPVQRRDLTPRYYITDTLNPYQIKLIGLAI